MTAVAPSDKYRRYRERQRAKGLKLVRMWIPDPNAPGFKERLAEEAARLNAAPDDGWLDAAGADLERMIQAEEDAAKS